MANGPFGNPLSTGIALSGVIDIVTPVRQAEERKRQREASEKKERDQRAKELGAIMGKIAIDEDKIWWRYHDDARLQYADTIDKVQQMYSAGDYAGMYKTINQFDTKMANYIQATNQKSKWEDSVRKGDKYYDQTYLNALENRDVDMPDLVKIADESGFGAYDPNTNILGFIDPVQRIDLREKVKKAIDGQKYMYEKQGKSLKVSGYGASGEPVYEMSLQDRQGTIDAVKKSIQPQAVPYMLMEMGYSKEDQLNMTPQELDQRLNEAIENTYNLYDTKEERGPIPKEGGGGFSFSMGSGKSEESIFNKSGGRELKIEGGNVLKTKGQYDITFTKGAGKTTMDVTDGSYEIDQNTGEFKKANYSGSLSDAIPVAPIVDENGQEWYMAISQGDVADKDVNLATLLLAIRQDPDADTLSLVQKELAKAKYGKTYLIKGNDSVRNQFWGKILGQDYTKQRAADAMKELGKSEPAPSGGAASASSSSSASVPSSDIQKMSGMKYGDFNNASNKAWVDETAKKIRSMSNLDDLWKQTGKSGTPNGQSNAELLAGFVESGKTSLLTGTPGGANTPSFQ